MRFRSLILGCACLTILSLGMTDRACRADSQVNGLAAADTAEVRPDDKKREARLVGGMGSADKIMDLLEYLVVKLADRENAWIKNIQPNLEIFLYGVATDQPIRFDYVLDETHGGQMQTMLPMTDLKEFLLDNLEPIGIDSDRDRSDRNLYELTGEVYEGWLRYLPEPVPYSIIFPQKEKIPADMEHPATLNQQFIDKGVLAFLLIDNSADGAAERKAAFQKQREISDESFQKLSTETREQFELRKQMRTLTFDILQQWLVEGQRILLEASVDTEAGHLPLDLSFAALPDTPLAADLKTLKEHGSLFSGIQAPENNILTLRVNLPLSKEQIPGMKKMYELARPVMKERIKTDDDSTPEADAAMEEVVSMVLDILTENLETQPTVDLFADAWPSGEHHVLVMGASVTGQPTIEKIVDKLPTAAPTLKVEKNADKVDNVDIHRITFTKAQPQSLIDFFGDSGEIYLGVGEGSLWLSAGQDALTALKDRIEIVAKSEPGAGDGTLAIAEMNVYPVLETYQSVKEDPDIKLLKQLNINRRLQRRAEDQDKKAKGPESRSASRASTLAGFVWIPTALENLKGQPDRMTLKMQLDENDVLIGHSDADVGVLKAIGALIAKFSDENLQ